VVVVVVVRVGVEVVLTVVVAVVNFSLSGIKERHTHRVNGDVV